MERRAVRVKKCYTLSSGQVVRITSIHEEMARCDMFDEPTQKWMQLQSALPLSLLKEECRNPVKDK
jgi:uncharacterized protein (UPF0179 family)